MKETGPLYQWAGAEGLKGWYILEGSANMVAAMPGGGRQEVSEPPTQLCGASGYQESVRRPPTSLHL